MRVIAGFLLVSGKVLRCVRSRYRTDKVAVFKKLEGAVNRRQVCGILGNFFSDICGREETIHRFNHPQYLDPLGCRYNFSAVQNVCFVKFSHNMRVAQLQFICNHDGGRQKSSPNLFLRVFRGTCRIITNYYQRIS